MLPRVLTCKKLSGWDGRPVGSARQWIETAIANEWQRGCYDGTVDSSQNLQKLVDLPRIKTPCRRDRSAEQQPRLRIRSES